MLIGILIGYTTSMLRRLLTMMVMAYGVAMMFRRTALRIVAAMVFLRKCVGRALRLRRLLWLRFNG